MEIKRLTKDRLDRFFFARSDGTAEALFRIGYAVVLLVDLLGQYGKLELLFSNQGLLFGTPVDGLYTPFLVKTIYFLWLATLLALATGCLTRWSSVLNFVIIFYFYVLRGAFVGHGADWVYHSMGFYLMLMTTDRRFTLFKTTRASWGNTSAMWPLRLAQINFLFIYFSAGVTKLFDPGWLDGSALELVFRHPFVTYSTATWMGSSHGFLILLTYATIIWQCSAPLALVSRKIRLFYILTALFFHVMIAISMRVGWFSEIMIVSTFLFWDDLEFFVKRWRGVTTGEPSIAPVWPVTKLFILVHLTVFMLTQGFFVSWYLGSPLKAGKIPGIYHYSVHVNGNRPYDLVPSKYVLQHVRFVAFEVTDSSGKRMLLPPFSSDGEFKPPLQDIKEIRRGLMILKIATRGLKPKGWVSLLKYDVIPEISRQELTYPVSINVFVINTPIADAPRPFNIHSVPKALVFTATVQSPRGGLELKTSGQQRSHRQDASAF